MENVVWVEIYVRDCLYLFSPLISSLKLAGGKSIPEDERGRLGKRDKIWTLKESTEVKETAKLPSCTPE